MYDSPERNSFLWIVEPLEEGEEVGKRMSLVSDKECNEDRGQDFLLQTPKILFSLISSICGGIHMFRTAQSLVEREGRVGGVGVILLVWSPRTGRPIRLRGVQEGGGDLRREEEKRKHKDQGD